MRLLYLLDQDFPDRTTQTIQVMNSGVELARLGVPVTLFVRRLLTEDREELFARFGLRPEPGFTQVALHRGRKHLDRWRGPWFHARLASILRRHGGPGTVIYSRGRGAVEAARIAAVVGRLFAIPVVYEVHKFYARFMAENYRDDARRKDDPERFLRGKARHLAKIRRREDALLRTVTGLVTINRGLEARVRARYPGRPVVTIPSAARAPDRIAVDSERDLDVIYLGDVGPKKGVEVLVDAMARLPGRRLLIHGRHRIESVETALVERIRNLGLEDRVTFGGWIPSGEVPPLLARARVGVLPYRGGWAETSTFVSPLKLVEMMLAGVPIVASDLPSLREMVTDGESGLLVSPDDPDALATGVARVLDDRAEASRLAAGAREAARDFTWRRRAERVIEFLESLRRDP